MSLSATELIRSGDKVSIYNPSKSCFIELEFDGYGTRANWIIGADGDVIQNNSVITLLDSDGGKYLSCKYLSTNPSYWIVTFLDKNTDSEALLDSFCEIRLVCKCHKRILQYVPSDFEPSKIASDCNIWRIVHSDRLVMGIFASHLPSLLMTPAIDNKDKICDDETCIFSEDKILEKILMSFYCLNDSGVSSNCNYFLGEKNEKFSKFENFQIEELLGFSQMLHKNAEFVEEQIGCYAPSCRVDAIRRNIATQIYNIMGDLYNKISSLDLSSNGLLKLRTALEPEIEIFTIITNMIPVWKDLNTINFLPENIETLQNPTYTKLHRYINDLQQSICCSSNDYITVLCDILDKSLPKIYNKNIYFTLADELFIKLNINKAPLLDILNNKFDIYNKKNFERLFPDSFRIKYISHQSLCKKIIQAKHGLTKVWLNPINFRNNENNLQILKLQNGISILRWRMRVYLDELDLRVRLDAYSIPKATSLDELIKGYKDYCNSLKFDVRLYDVLYECLQFAKYFTTSHSTNKAMIKDSESKLSQLWSNFYKHCAVIEMNPTGLDPQLSS